MNKPQTLGEIGYEKWRSLLPPSARAGLPGWDRLPEGSRLGWEDVAKAVTEAYETYAALPDRQS